MNCLFLHFTKEKKKQRNLRKKKNATTETREKQADSVRQKAKQNELFAHRQLLPLLLPVQVLCPIKV